jgi:hypothetical protein
MQPHHVAFLQARVLKPNEAQGPFLPPSLNASNEASRGVTCGCKSPRPFPFDS